jgi:hypothetical protein
MDKPTMAQMLQMGSNFGSAMRNQAPGMGSAENAVPHGNQFADDKAAAEAAAKDYALKSMLSYGAGFGALMTPPNPISAIAAMAGGGGGAAYGLAQSLEEQKARRLGYQGN